MATDVLLPDLGENIKSGQVVNVLIAEGDTIRPEQPMIEIETDKATIEVPSSVGGRVAKVHVRAGEKVDVGAPIITVEEVHGAQKPAPLPEPKPVKAEAKEEKAPEPKAAPAATFEEKAAEPAEAPAAKAAVAATSVPGEAALVPAAPSVRRLAREIGVDITSVIGTGPGGRITYDDVKAFSKRLHEESASVAVGISVPSEALPDFTKWGPVEREDMSNIRRKTAEHLSYAWATIPHVTQFDRADITELERWRKAHSPTVERAGAKLTITAIALKIVAVALGKFPKFNASVDMEKRQIVYKRYYHIGVAVETDRGLLVPVIRDVNRKSLVELAVELGQLSQKARDRKLTLDEMQGATFTITNLGGIGGTNFTPIVNAPEVAILAIARASMEPTWDKDAGTFKPRLILPLGLSYDHRLIDGADGARFLRSVAQTFEDPLLMVF